MPCATRSDIVSCEAGGRKLTTPTLLGKDWLIVHLQVSLAGLQEQLTEERALGYGVSVSEVQYASRHGFVELVVQMAVP